MFRPPMISWNCAPGETSERSLGGWDLHCVTLLDGPVGRPAGRQRVGGLTEQWPGKWCRQGAFVWPDKAGEERGREGKQTEQEAGAQCSGIPSHPPPLPSQPLRGFWVKRSWMTAFWNAHKWERVLIGRRLRLVWSSKGGRRFMDSPPCVFYVLGRPCGRWLTNQTKTQVVVERESSGTKWSCEFSLSFFFFAVFVQLKKQRMVCGLAAADVVSCSRRTRTMWQANFGLWAVLTAAMGRF